MNTCPHCHIKVGGDSTYCPLCQNRLPGPAEAAYFPATAPRIHRASLLYKIIAFLLSAVVVVAGAFDFLLLDDTPHRHFSLLLAVGFLAALRVLRSVLRRRSSRRCSSLPTGSTATQATALIWSCRSSAALPWGATSCLPFCAADSRQMRWSICS